jgi:hypothetical protein
VARNLVVNSTLVRARTGFPAKIGSLSLPDSRRLANATIWVLVPLVIMLLSWHLLPLEPEPGLDPSWQAALQMAAHDGITFGHDLIFTYGPLGFLSVPTLWYTDTGTIAVIYAVLLRLVLASALFWGARRTYGAAAGAVVALVVACASGVALETVPVFIFCVWIVDRVSAPRERLTLMAIGGAVAGVELLNKVSIGIEITVLVTVTALAARGRRRDHLIVVFAALISALLVAWTATGQDLGSIAAYARNSARIVSGYAAAMSSEEPSLGWQYTAGWVAFAFGLAGALHMTVDGPTRRRWGIVALWFVFCFFEYKDGFIRHDLGHSTIYFVALMGGFLAFRWQPASRLVGLGLAAALVAFAFAAQDSSFSTVFKPGEDVDSAVNQVEQVANPSERAFTMARGRQAIKNVFPIDQPTLNLLRGHTVDVEPYQAAVAWAYNLDWRPLPVFQSYSAYTTGLDQEDADALQSPRAPQRILRNLDVDIDGRVQAFDEGLTSRTILCRYQELRTTGAWEVLGLGPDRCGAPVSLGTVHAGWDQAISVPTPPNNHSFIFVRIGGVAVGGLERLYALLYKPAERDVSLNGTAHRLIEDTAPDGLILRAAPGVDFTPPFNLAPESSTIAVDKAGQGSDGGKPLTFAFFAQSVSVGPRYGPLQREIGGTASSVAAVPASSTLTASGEAVIAEVQDAIVPYCSSSARTARVTSVVTDAVNELVVLYGHHPDAVVAQRPFAGRTVSEVLADVGGLLNGGCARPLGSRVGLALRGKREEGSISGR